MVRLILLLAIVPQMENADENVNAEDFNHTSNRFQPWAPKA